MRTPLTARPTVVGVAFAAALALTSCSPASSESDALEPSTSSSPSTPEVTPSTDAAPTVSPETSSPPETEPPTPPFNPDLGSTSGVGEGTWKVSPTGPWTLSWEFSDCADPRGGFVNVMAADGTLNSFGGMFDGQTVEGDRILAGSSIISVSDDSRPQVLGDLEVTVTSQGCAWSLAATQDAPGAGPAPATEPCSSDTIATALISYGEGALSRGDALAAAGPSSSRDMSDWLDFLDSELAADPSADPAGLLGGGAGLEGLCA